MSAVAKVVKESTPQDGGGDPTVGLKVGGRLFYTRLSTLTKGFAKGSYFEKRFGSDSAFSSSDYEYLDEYGRKIYFIDGDEDLFAHILQYLRRGTLPPLLGGFYVNPELWRALRLEADFYQLERLSNSLKVVYSCSPELNGDRGVLHWLGTNKGRDEYQNPFELGQVHVGGWTDENPPLGELHHYACHLNAGMPQARALWVQYRPKAKVVVENDACFIDTPGAGRVGYCSAATVYRRPIVIDIRSVTLCPTHYSIRFESCSGMSGDWSFEASVDGENWDVLHQARENDYLVGLQGEEERRFTEYLEEEFAGDDAEKDDLTTSYLEAYHRRTWEVKSALFYRYFRIIGAGDEDTAGCLHGVGLELFGHVHES